MTTGDDIALRLAAGRAVAADLLPYLRAGLYAMVPVLTPAVPVCAVDNRWRIYVNPESLLHLTVDETAGLWLHELSHVLHQHADRWTALLEPDDRHSLYTVAADAAVNEILGQASVVVPPAKAGVWQDVPGAEPGMTTEQMYRLLLDAPAARQSTGLTLVPSRVEEGRHPTKITALARRPAFSGEPTVTVTAEDGTTVRTDSAKVHDRTSVSFTVADPLPAGGFQVDVTCGTRSLRAELTVGATGHEAHDDEPADAETGADDCGSGVAGGRRPWDRPDDDSDDGSVDEGRAELLRRQVAKDIRTHQRSMGDVPSGLLRLADEILTPLVDWRRELHSVVNRTRASVAGLRDYTYTRVSRRAAAAPGIVLPTMRQPRPPRLDIVIDTSGSVSDHMLAQVKAELRVIARNLRGDNVRVLACDAASAQPRRLRRVDDIALLGGGGTDMRAGLAASAQLRPRADIVIVATDGDTPWNSTPPEENPRARYLTLLLDGDRPDVPAWMHKIVLSAGR